MAAVRTGTRLEQLEQLRTKTRQQLATARRRDERHAADRLRALLVKLDREIALQAAKGRNNHQTERLLGLGITARDVKVWAVETGLLPAVVRGRVATALIEAYAAAHQHTPQEPHTS